MVLTEWRDQPESVEYAAPPRYIRGMDESEDIFRDLCENASDLIQSVSPDAHFQYVNQAWLETLGYTKEEVADLTLPDIVHPDSWPHCEEMMEKVMQGLPAVHVEADFRAKDGRRIPVEGSASCRFDGDQVIATVGIFRDVSKTRDAEEELDRLFTVSLDLLCVAGTDGYFKQINPAFKRILGYTEEELLSRSFLDFVHPEDVESTIVEVERLAQGLPVVDFENRYRAKDGSYRWLAWRSAPVAARGLIYAVARDVTEQKRIEKLMVEQAADLARSNADLEQFAYAASHDLRAPLRAIGHLSEWIAEDLAAGSHDNVQEHAGKLRAQVRRMETLIDDLLRYARAGREHGSVVEVNTSELVEELTALLAPPEGFTVTVEGEMPVIKTEKAPLEQVLRNLIGNAIKHHDRPHGKVVVSARSSGDRYEFLVADDGPGIPAESRNEIFKMFEKLGLGKGVEGTGMGLALVKRIVESQHGSVWVEAPPMRGAVFHFTWPARPTDRG